VQLVRERPADKVRIPHDRETNTYEPHPADRARTTPNLRAKESSVY